MLRELSVRNFATIEELRLELPPGLVVLTGETGAGKSIIMDALGWALGDRPDEEQIRGAADEGVVEAAFELPRDRRVHEVLAGEGIPQERDEYLVLRRHVLRGGRSKAYVNGRLSSAATLRALGSLLVDVHGQGQGQSLLEPRRHRELLDAYAGLEEDVAGFRERHRRAAALRRELDAAAERARDREQRLDLLRHQHGEIAAARLTPGEEEALQAERTVLANVERLLEATRAALALLAGDEGGARDAARRAAARLREAERLDGRAAEPRGLVEQAGDLLGEAVRELERYADRLEFDPGRLEEIQSRLHALERLKRKYGSTVEAILQHDAGVVRELEELAAVGETLPQREAEWQALQKELAAAADALSAARLKAARGLERKIAAELKDLGFARAGFQVPVVCAEGPEALGPTGRDSVEFLFAPNPGEDPKPLHKIASGGELSRTMLAIKAILARADRVPTLIFDEVDAGIGGGMADVVGRRLYAVADGRQVLCVTHLAQIAALADAHLLVSKQIARGATTTLVRRLDADRPEEVARMLGGHQDAAVPLEHARQILDAARAWKRKARRDR